MVKGFGETLYFSGDGNELFPYGSNQGDERLSFTSWDDGISFPHKTLSSGYKVGCSYYKDLYVSI